MSTLTRREILTAAGAVAAGLTSISAASATAATRGSDSGPQLCLFSKPLPFLGYAELAETLKDLSIPGVDLTTRPQGHVLPERVTEDLPKARTALEREGIGLPMITTGLTTIHDPAARPTLYTAAELGVPFFKLGYYRYRDISKLEETLAKVKKEVEGLAALSAHAEIQGGFHNHSGAYVGAAMWDHWWILRDTDTQWMGFYFDPCHATIEGGSEGWAIGFQRLAERVKMVAIKDFYWEKRNGKWERRVCPLGEGMVNLPKFFAMLAATGFSGPISLHVEYEIEGPTEAARREKVVAAIDRDFKLMRQLVNEAFA